MKAVLLNKYRPNSRNIAESMWGIGGTNSHRVNRNGATYYSCAGHGGYIVLANALTEEERANIDKHIQPESIELIVQAQATGDYVVGVFNHMSRGRTRARVAYKAYLGEVRREKFFIYTFEEDCAWSILEKFTDIRLKQGQERPEFYQNRENFIEECFQRWYGSKK
jgi:hypothetical protein